ncbi:hypothetical protein [Burkholderia cepacia]|uniref:hypothetical protein n=1 Tax=Burkholderia cepacia TaxID=292 RepID=UPI001575A9E1|nr:hypothetical protein [Burkholderia cepacia]
MPRPIVTLMQRAKALLPEITADLDIGHDGVVALATLLSRVNYRPHSHVLPESRQVWLDRLSERSLLAMKPDQRIRVYRKFALDLTEPALKDIEQVLEWRAKHGDSNMPESQRFAVEHLPVSNALDRPARPTDAQEQDDVEKVADALLADAALGNSEWSAW